MNESSSSVVSVNGVFYAEAEASLSALDRGFTLGDGIFETMLAVHGRVFRLAQHLARLHQGAAALEIPLPPDADLERALQETLSRCRDARVVLRLTVSRGVGQGRGIALPPAASPTVVVRATSFVPLPPESTSVGLRAAISSVRRNEGSPLSRIKSCNYGDAILARRQAQQQGYDEAIMLNNRGEVACASVANLFTVREGRLWTPPEECGVLPGVTRACVLELAAALAIPAQDVPFSADALQGADEAFLTNTVAGIVPLVEVDGQPVGSGRPGPLTARVASAYQALMNAETSA